MLQANRMHSINFSLKVLALSILGSDMYLSRAEYVPNDTGNRQATLFYKATARARQNFWIDVDLLTVSITGNVDNGYAFQDANLWRAQTNPAVRT